MTKSRSARCASSASRRRARTSTARPFCAPRAPSRASSAGCAAWQYAPPSDLDIDLGLGLDGIDGLDDLGPDVLDAFLDSPRALYADLRDELRAHVTETATLHRFIADMLAAGTTQTAETAETEAILVASIPVHAFASGIVLAACERTYALRTELRAAGGVWRVVPTASGSVLGWAFPNESAQCALDLVTRTADDFFETGPPLRAAP